MIKETKNDSELNEFASYILEYIQRKSKLTTNSNLRMPSWYIKEDDVESRDKNINSYIG